MGSETTDPIVARIARAVAEGDPLEALVRGLPPSDLQSLLLHVFRVRSAARRPAELLAQFARAGMFAPSSADPRALVEIERVALECAEKFEAVDLAPVAPVGVNRVLGGIDQNRALATVRNAEVLADPTSAMALECARRRRAGEGGTMRLCGRSRMLRLQPLLLPTHSAHFALFAMASAGRDRGGHDFEVESLLDHVAVLLEALARLAQNGYRFAEVEVAVADTERDARRTAIARERVLAPLGVRYPGVRFRIDPERERARAYYRGPCFNLDATDPEGTRFNLGDGGFTDWTARLLSNAKERFLGSALGTELVAKRFRAPRSGR